jgi:hypothetical protein
MQRKQKNDYSFFLENTGELRFISLRRKKRDKNHQQNKHMRMRATHTNTQHAGRQPNNHDLKITRQRARTHPTSRLTSDQPKGLPDHLG